MNKYVLLRLIEQVGPDREQLEIYLAQKGCRFIERTYRAALELYDQANDDSDLASPEAALHACLAQYQNPKSGDIGDPQP